MSILYSSKPHPAHLLHKPKSSFQNKTNKRILFTFFSRNPKLPTIFAFADQDQLSKPNQKSTSSVTKMLLQEPPLPQELPLEEFLEELLLHSQILLPANMVFKLPRFLKSIRRIHVYCNSTIFPFHVHYENAKKLFPVAIAINCLSFLKFSLLSYINIYPKALFYTSISPKKLFCKL